MIVLKRHEPGPRRTREREEQSRDLTTELRTETETDPWVRPGDQRAAPAARRSEIIEREAQKQAHAKDAPAGQPRGTRLVSLDAFRGLTIVGMLLVNNVALDAATPTHLLHAEWSGKVTFADMVFPWFLFIVGVALSYAEASRRRRQTPPGEHWLRVLSRTAALVLLGCVIDSSIAKRLVFDLGVLQLIGLAYCAGTLLSGLLVRNRILTAAGLLVAHWAAIRFVPVPGIGAGVFTEEVNLIRHLNETYLQNWGLSGLISVVPTTALVVIGTVVGDLIRAEKLAAVAKTRLLALAGLGLIAAGWLWSLDLPFNKPLWTASYILFTGGWACLVLGLFYYLVDVRGWRGWTFPLAVFGSNAIVAYVAPILIKVHILQEWTWQIPSGSHLPLQQAMLHQCILLFGRVPGGVVYTAAYILFWWAMLLVLYRKKIFLRV